MTCFTCDTRDIPAEGLPLTPVKPDKPVKPSHQNAVGDMRVPLSDAKPASKFHRNTNPTLNTPPNPYVPDVDDEARGGINTDAGTGYNPADGTDFNLRGGTRGNAEFIHGGDGTPGLNPGVGAGDATGFNPGGRANAGISFNLGGDDVGFNPDSEIGGGVGNNPGRDDGSGDADSFTPDGGTGFNPEIGSSGVNNFKPSDTGTYNTGGLGFNPQSSSDSPSFNPGDLLPSDGFDISGRSSTNVNQKTSSNLDPSVGFNPSVRRPSDLHKAVNPSANFQSFRVQSDEYSSRQRRSIKKPYKPINVKISRKTKGSVTLMKMVTLLKDMIGHMDYEIISGNTTLFHLNEGNHGITYLNSTEQLHPGKYALSIRGGVRKNNGDIEKKLNRIYSDSRHLYLKVTVHVV